MNDIQRQNFIDSFLLTSAAKLPEEKIIIVKNKIMEASPEQLSQLQLVSLKDPMMLLIVSILGGSFGIDRFLAGDVGLGVLKLLTCGGCGIWTIIDWFMIGNRAKQVNFERIMTVL